MCAADNYGILNIIDIDLSFDFLFLGSLFIIFEEPLSLLACRNLMIHYKQIRWLLLFLVFFLSQTSDHKTKNRFGNEQRVQGMYCVYALLHAKHCMYVHVYMTIGCRCVYG